MQASEGFCRTLSIAALAGGEEADGVALTVRVQDQGRTADLLRSGTVLAAVTAEPAAVQGCSVQRLGSLRELAAASPALLERHRRGGRLRWADLPLVAFDESDDLQHRLLERRGHPAPPVVHRVPATEGFLGALTSGWAGGSCRSSSSARWSRPAASRRSACASGSTWRCWQRWRLPSPLLDRLTDRVRAAAAAHLRQ